jgi:hypothetical protein
MKVDKAEKFVEDVDVFSDGRLKEKEFVKMLIDVAIQTGRMEVIMDIAFYSKFLWKIFTIIKSGRRIEGTDEIEFKVKLTSQFSEVLEKIHTLIKILVRDFPEDRKGRFIERFLKTTPECFENTMNLIHDFYWVKNWEIEVRRNERNN